MSDTTTTENKEEQKLTSSVSHTAEGPFYDIQEKGETVESTVTEDMTKDTQANKDQNIQKSLDNLETDIKDILDTVTQLKGKDKPEPKESVTGIPTSYTYTSYAGAGGGVGYKNEQLQNNRSRLKFKIVSDKAVDLKNKFVVTSTIQAIAISNLLDQFFSDTVNVRHDVISTLTEIYNDLIENLDEDAKRNCKASINNFSNDLSFIGLIDDKWENIPIPERYLIRKKLNDIFYIESSGKTGYIPRDYNYFNKALDNLFKIEEDEAKAEKEKLKEATTKEDDKIEIANYQYATVAAILLELLNTEAENNFFFDVTKIDKASQILYGVSTFALRNSAKKDTEIDFVGLAKFFSSIHCLEWKKMSFTMRIALRNSVLEFFQVKTIFRAEHSKLLLELVDKLNRDDQASEDKLAEKLKIANVDDLSTDTNKTHLSIINSLKRKTNNLYMFSFVILIMIFEIFLAFAISRH